MPPPPQARAPRPTRRDLLRGRIRDARLRIPFGFDAKNEAAQRVAKKQAARMVVDVSTRTMRGIRAVVVRSIDEGISPYDAARLIRGMVGLDERRANAVLNYRAELVETGLPAARVEVLAERYADKLLRQRADTIARTEIMAALNEGGRESWRQAVEDGYLSKTARKRWITTPDERLCDVCGPLDGVEVPLLEDFPEPGPPAHPNCRCAAVPIP